MTLRRYLTADRLNPIANHPDVRPWIGGGLDQLDLTAVASDPANVLLLDEFGGCLFEHVGAGTYEVHTLFLPEGRGVDAVSVVRAALRWMFTKTDCVELQTRVPDGNKGALGLVRAIHGRQQFRREKAWQSPDGMIGVAFYSLTLNDWAGTSEDVSESGHDFHEKLEDAKIAMGGTTDVHDDDEAHDRYVGATVEMMLSGQVEKALWFYNRWARFSGYAQVRQIGTAPVLIDIQDAIVALGSNGFEVLLCR